MTQHKRTTGRLIGLAGELLKRDDLRITKHSVEILTDDRTIETVQFEAGGSWVCLAVMGPDLPQDHAEPDV